MSYNGKNEKETLFRILTAIFSFICLLTCCNEPARLLDNLKNEPNLRYENYFVREL